MPMKTTFICVHCGGTSYEQFSQTQVECLQCKKISFFDTGYTVQPSYEIPQFTETIEPEKPALTSTASLGKRITNYLLDTFAISFIVILIAKLLSIPTETNIMELYTPGRIVKAEDFTFPFLLMGCLLIYYTFMEYAFGKTIGKYITRTKVISVSGAPLSLQQCIIRSFSRMIPFERVSGLFFGNIFWHDSIAKTRVIEEDL
jgi:uncharacterized RDD family membrane protein YckC